MEGQEAKHIFLKKLSENTIYTKTDGPLTFWYINLLCSSGYVWKVSSNQEPSAKMKPLHQVEFSVIDPIVIVTSPDDKKCTFCLRPSNHDIYWQ